MPEPLVDDSLIGTPVPAFRCEACHESASWTLCRHGDAVVTWACSPHLSAVLIALQREWEEQTKVTVTFRWEAT